MEKYIRYLCENCGWEDYGLKVKNLCPKCNEVEITNEVTVLKDEKERTSEQS